MFSNTLSEHGLHWNKSVDSVVTTDRKKVDSKSDFYNGWIKNIRKLVAKTKDLEKLSISSSSLERERRF